MSDLQKQTIKRVYKCANKTCGDLCRFCVYRKKAANMIFEFLLEDMNTYYENTGKMISSWDVKEIFTQAYDKMVELEQEKANEEKSE